MVVELTTLVAAITALVGAIAAAVVAVRRAFYSVKVEVAEARKELQRVHITFNDKMDKANKILEAEAFARGREAMRLEQAEHNQGVP